MTLLKEVTIVTAVTVVTEATEGTELTVDKVFTVLKGDRKIAR